jgi:hypothetical protein
MFAAESQCEPQRLGERVLVHEGMMVIGGDCLDAAAAKPRQ